jgi:hypothetical protein
MARNGTFYCRVNLANYIGTPCAASSETPITVQVHMAVVWAKQFINLNNRFYGKRTTPI